MPNTYPTVCLIAGTRPEIIKLAPLHAALRSSGKIRPYWLSTGQHREMSAQALRAFGIRPDEDLDLMQERQTLPELTSRVVISVAESLGRLKPSAVIVQGDTTTAFASALAAFYQDVPVGHVEAGLRTRDFHAPWPEELNRRLIAPLSRWCFAPTEAALANLRSEGIEPGRCHLTGNTIVDALHWMRDRLTASTESLSTRANRIGLPEDFLSRYTLEGGGRGVLVTLHRRESFGGGIERACRSIRQLLDEVPEAMAVLPLHPNESAHAPILEILSEHPRAALIAPVGYEDFIWLMLKSWFIISDSGGIQEEAPSLGKRVLVARNTTERMEGVHAGACRLVGTEPGPLLVAARELLLAPSADFEGPNPYGDGHAAERIVGILEHEISL